MIARPFKKKTSQIQIKNLGPKKSLSQIFQKYLAKNQKNPSVVFDFLLNRDWKFYIGQFQHTVLREKFWSAKRIIFRKKAFSHLNQQLNKSKLSPFFFKPWIKNEKFSLTERQKHLKNVYADSQDMLNRKERKDFFKTTFGEIFKTTDFRGAITDEWSVRRESPVRFSLKSPTFYLQMYKKLQKKNIKPIMTRKAPWCGVRSHKKQYSIVMNAWKKGWLYESLLKKNQLRYAEYFALDRPYSAFQNHFRQQKKEPWIDPLVFKRWTYFGFMEKNRKALRDNHRPLKFKVYLRKRNPRFQKRNKLYYWRMKLLQDFYKKNRVRKKKAKRIKQVLEKIYLPFYGHLRKKQFTAIVKKKKKKKSQLLNRNERILSSLENRLDVVVYRLNYAPNILWARRLILEGSIFVSNMFSSQDWICMYSQIKHLAFPLKLRDPKNLYKTNKWLPNQKRSQFKFFLSPMKKIHYLVQPGDLIQSAKTLRINQMKVNKRLFKKTIQKNFYTIKKIRRYYWNNVGKGPRYSATKDAAKHITASLFLFDARSSDFKKYDRARELFFRWITL